MSEYKSNQKQRSSFPAYARYSGLAFQMIIILLVAVWGGRKLDVYFELHMPLFTVVLSLTALFIILYLTIRSVMRK